MSQPQTDSLIGAVLSGRYEIVARISRGGTAVVYRGIDRRLGRNVAIKVIHSDLSGDPEYVKRFDREARAAAILSHPNIVAVFDQGRAGERPYIVMEFIRGQSLRSIIASSAPLPPTLALAYAHEVAKALAAAHEAGIIHRDIKPENVLITNDGQVKVTDFGLAKTVAAPTTTASQGVLMGTMSYIAPEIPASGSATVASDVYSLGVVMYEMLTGRKPHTGEDLSQVLYKHVHEDIPPPSQAFAGRGRIPDYVDALVTACTSRDPLRRPGSGRSLEIKIGKARRALDAGVRSDPKLAQEFLSGGPEETTPIPLLFTNPAVPPAPAPDEDTPVSPGPPPPIVKLSSVRPAARPPVRPAPPPPPKAPRSRGTMVAVLILTLVALAALGTLAWWLLAGRWALVTTVDGLSEQAGLELLAADSFKVTTETENSETVKKGLIIRTEPVAGTRVPKGSTVTVFISLGPERFAMPKVVGLTEQEARDALAAAHLTVGEIKKAYSETVEDGLVISASQDEGAKLKRDTPVDLTVSQGREPITVVSYVGKPLAEATKAFEGAGLKVVKSEDYSRTVPKGSIISQDPSQGTLYRGDTVNVTVSLGPRMIKVPKVIGIGLDAAREELAKAGFAVDAQNVNPSNLTIGVVVGTDPGPGEYAAEGSTIIVKYY